MTTYQQELEIRTKALADAVAARVKATEDCLKAETDLDFTPESDTLYSRLYRAYYEAGLLLKIALLEINNAVMRLEILKGRGLISRCSAAILFAGERVVIIRTGEVLSVSDHSKSSGFFIPDGKEMPIDWWDLDLDWSTCRLSDETSPTDETKALKPETKGGVELCVDKKDP